MAETGTAQLQAPIRQQQPRRGTCFGLFALAVAAYATFPFGGAPSQRREACAESDSAFIHPFVGIRQKAQTQPRVRLYAETINKPGGKPVLDTDEAAESKLEDLPPGVIPFQMQYDAMKRDEKFLKALRGKFVRRGKKPWDPHQFTTTEVRVNLDALQGQNTKILNQVIEELRRITAVHPENILAKTDNATLKQRKGMIVGLKSTMTTVKNLDFLKRLNMITLPRVRDFNGLWPNYFRDEGSYALTIPSQEAFKELDELVDDREYIHGFKIKIRTNCYTHVDAMKLMKDFGFPFNPQPHRKVVVNKAVVASSWVSMDKKKQQGRKKKR